MLFSWIFYETKEVAWGLKEGVIWEPAVVVA